MTTATQNSNRLTVLHLVSSEGYFGVENMLVNLGVALSKLGCHFIAGVFQDSRACHIEVADRARAQGLSVELVPCTGRFDLSSVAHIRRLIGLHQVDIVHTHGYKADLYACAAGAWSRAGFVATCHNWLGHSWSMRAYAALDRLSMRAFDRVVVVSEAVAAILRRSGIPAAKLNLIANGVELERFHDAAPSLRNLAAPNGESLIGFVGRLVPEKGGEALLNAAQIVLRSHPRTKFVFVGDGPARHDWESLATQLGIGNQVLFAGTRDDMPAVYASLEMLVLPSLCEAMPMCVLEAMASAKPVIATRVGSVPRLVKPDHAGMLVDPGDMNALSAAMIQFLNNPDRARQMGQNGQAAAAANFSADSMAEQYLELYREVVRLRPILRRKLSYAPTA